MIKGSKKRWTTHMNGEFKEIKSIKKYKCQKKYAIIFENSFNKLINILNTTEKRVIRKDISKYNQKEHKSNRENMRTEDFLLKTKDTVFII